MAVNQINRTASELEAEEKTTRSKIDKLGADLVSELDDMPVRKEDGKQVNLKVHPRDVDIEEEDEEDEPEDEEQEEEQPETKEEEKTEKKEEDPQKVKYEKSIQKLERRIQQEVAKRKEIEAKLETNDFKTTRRSKLENMSEKELQQLKLETRREWKKAEDATRETQLEDLEQEIDKVLRDAPNRFVNAQAKAYSDKVQEIIDDDANESIDFDKDGAKIKQIAEQIYSTKRELQKLVGGQALALELAVEHYKVVMQNNKAKDNEGDLKRKVNTLKKKTLLEGPTTKGKVSNSSLRKQYQRAKNGMMDDKFSYLENFIDVDSYLS